MDNDSRHKFDVWKIATYIDAKLYKYHMNNNITIQQKILKYTLCR